MLMLPIGSDRGLSAGEIYFVERKKEAARIKVQSTDKGFALYILPRFGEPNDFVL